MRLRIPAARGNLGQNAVSGGTAMNIDLLKRLCETPGVPGYEGRVRSLIEHEIEGLFDEVRTDPMGSLLCRRNAKAKAKNPLRIMLLCHMDEIGFLVSHISDKGYLYLQPVGGFDPRNLFSRRVTVCTATGDIKGVMNPGGKPIHISSDAERTKVPGVEEFFVDLGMAAADGAMVMRDQPRTVEQRQRQRRRGRRDGQGKAHRIAATSSNAGRGRRGAVPGGGTVGGTVCAT
jgi:putative aminopeptidase FrvX